MKKEQSGRSNSSPARSEKMRKPLLYEAERTSLMKRELHILTKIEKSFQDHSGLSDFGRQVSASASKNKISLEGFIISERERGILVELARIHAGDREIDVSRLKMREMRSD